MKNEKEVIIEESFEDYEFYEEDDYEDNQSNALETERRDSSFNSRKICIQFGQNNPNINDNYIFGNNTIKTTKYNAFTLIPKNLFFQFMRASNIYFLIVSILTFMPFSPKEPVSMIGTFLFVLIFTMIKDAIVDYFRGVQDKISNNRLTEVFFEGRWIQDRCYKLKPGDIIKIKEDEECSCDAVIIRSSNENGYLYIDTKNLDGETNLKEKSALGQLKDIPLSENQIEKIIGEITTKPSDANLNQWEGNMVFGNMRSIYCSIENLLLKGTILKNTNFVVGIVVYAGHSTKIMKNSRSPIPKTSKMIKTMDKLMYSLFAFTLILCLIFAILNCEFVDNHALKYDYIFIDYDEDAFKNKYGIRLILNFMTFFVAYAQIIPISLYVCMEIIKIFQGILMKYDFELYDLSIDKPGECRDSSLIEELGQVDFIISDKTGTLTRNEMEFKKCFVNGKIYGAEKSENDCTDAYNSINGDFSAFEMIKNINAKGRERIDKEKLEKFFLLLCTCHDVFPDTKSGKIEYQGASPDDIALVRGAQQLGIEFQRKEYGSLYVKNFIGGEEIKVDVEVLIPFDSDRKRQSVLIFHNIDQKYYIFSKGADTAMLSKNNNINKILITKFSYKAENLHLEQILDRFSKEGLRILVMGWKEVNKEKAKEWIKRVKEAKLGGKAGTLGKIYDEMEEGLEFLGCSAIEDKLQEGVPETIKTLMNCGIRLWVLTGDKIETAEQIARQCNLIDDKMLLYNFSRQDKEQEIFDKVLYLVRQYNLEQYMVLDKLNPEKISYKFMQSEDYENHNLSIIIDGATLQKILCNRQLGKMFFLLGIISKSVICCRVTPKQKSLVVKLAKSHGDFVTLSIGDGANDVPMIMEASIGVGIQGKEGTQAVRSSDYSIGQFRFLVKLLLFYGRNGYVKIAKYICYYFYKNIVLVVTELVFVFYDGFSGQIFFPDWYGTMFNAVFTSWPCIVVFMYERELSVKVCEKFPILYRAGPRNYYFNLTVFWEYVFFGLVHSILCFYIPALSLNSIVDKYGNTFDNWTIATVSFTLVIHVVSFKLLLISNFWNWMSILFTIVAVLLYYVVIVLICFEPIGEIFQPQAIGVFNMIITNYESVIMGLLGPFVILIPDIIIRQIRLTFFPNPCDTLMTFQKDEKFLQIMENDNVRLDKEGSILVESQRKTFAAGYELVENIRSKMASSAAVIKVDKDNSRYPMKFGTSEFHGDLKGVLFKRLNMQQAQNEDKKRRISYNTKLNFKFKTENIEEIIKNLEDKDENKNRLNTGKSESKDEIKNLMNENNNLKERNNIGVSLLSNQKQKEIIPIEEHKNEGNSQSPSIKKKKKKEMKTVPLFGSGEMPKFTFHN